MSDFLLTNKLEKSFARTDEDRENKGNWKIGCVISLGTGVFPTEKIDGIDLIVAHAVSEHNVFYVSPINIQKNPIQFAKSCYKAVTSTRNLLHVLVKEVIPNIESTLKICFPHFPVYCFQWSTSEICERMVPFDQNSIFQVFQCAISV